VVLQVVRHLDGYENKKTIFASSSSNDKLFIDIYICAFSQDYNKIRHIYFPTTMTDITCPKCRTKGINTLSCDSCGLVFTEHEEKKQQAIADVYALISRGNLTEAKTVAEGLADDFPESKGEFVLLLSNINRDINIEQKFSQAVLLFEQKKYDDVALLLRNIKAFDPALEEKIIVLRKKAARHNEYKDILREAEENFTAGKFGRAKALFQTIHDSKEQELAEQYLKKIEKKITGMFNQALQCLQKNQFDAAEKRFTQLHAQFPEMAQKTTGYVAIIRAKKKIREELLSAAEKARDEGRALEARVMYTFLAWQYPEFQPRLDALLDQKGTQALATLNDLSGDETIDFAALGLKIDEYGLLTPHTGAGTCMEQGLINALPAPPDPVADAPVPPLDLEQQKITDFTC